MGFLRSAATGAVAGTAATIPMTAVMVLGERLTGYGRLPPEALVKNVPAQDVASLNGEDDVKPSEVEVAWRAAHLLAGAVFGATYSVAFRPLTPFLPAPVRGLLFGLCVWLVSYQGVAPALHLLPPATEDVPARQQTNVAAHAVFGASLGMMAARDADGRG